MQHRLSKYIITPIVASVLALGGITAGIAPARALTGNTGTTAAPLFSSTVETLVDGEITTIESSDVYHQKFHMEPVTKGINLYRFERFDKKGWVRGSILIADLRDSNVKTGLLYPGSMTSTSTVRGMVSSSGAVAGINGDFFDIYGTKAPLGVVVKNGKLLKSSLTWNTTIGVSFDKIGNIANMLLQGEIANTTTPDNPPVKLDGINEINLTGNEVVLFTNLWGKASRASLVKGLSNYVEMVVKDNVIVEILENKQYPGAIPNDAQIILGLGTGADRLLRSFKLNDSINITYTASPAFNNFGFALSGDVFIVKDGVPISHPTNPYTHPRTAAGFDITGTKMIMLVVDGRQVGSRGMTYDELGRFMASIGAWNAINLDSGGSSQMAARPLGYNNITVINNPSDGSERPVPNGIGLWSNDDTGTLSGFRIEALDETVFSGFSRTFLAYPYDSSYNPIYIDDQLGWFTDNPEIAAVEEAGVIKGKEPGKGNIVVQYENAASQHPIQVREAPNRIYPTNRQIKLNSTGRSTFRIYGSNRFGFVGLMEPRDITLDYDTTLMEITPSQNGQFSIRAKAADFSTPIKATAGDLVTYIEVTYGNVPESGITNPTDEDLPPEAANGVNFPEALDPLETDWDRPPALPIRFAVVNGLKPDRLNLDFIEKMQAKTYLKLLTSQDPDFIIFNGNMVSDAFNGDNFIQAKSAFDSLGLPYHTTPGRQEAAGNSTLSRYRDIFGEDFSSFDMGFTRFILLNTSKGSLRASNGNQWHMLLQALESGKNNPNIRNFVLIGQAPLQFESTLPGGGDDPNEAEFLHTLLTAIREQTGKHAAYISSGTGWQTSKWSEGIPYIDTGFGGQPKSAIITIDSASTSNDWIKVKLTP